MPLWRGQRQSYQPTINIIIRWTLCMWLHCSQSPSIVSTNSTNRCVLLMDTLHWIFKFFLLKICALKAPSRLRRSDALLSTRRPRFDPRSFHLRIVMDEVELGQVFLFSVSTSVFTCQYLSIKAPHSPSSTCCCYQDERTKSWEQFNIQQLYVLPTLYLCVLYLSENKQRLVPLTA